MLGIGPPPVQWLIHLLGPLGEVLVNLIVILCVVVVIARMEEETVRLFLSLWEDCLMFWCRNLSMGIMVVEMCLECSDIAVNLGLLEVPVQPSCSVPWV